MLHIENVENLRDRLVQKIEKIERDLNALRRVLQMMEDGEFSENKGGENPPLKKRKYTKKIKNCEPTQEESQKVRETISEGIPKNLSELPTEKPRRGRPPKEKPINACAVNGCNDEVHALGFCEKHYEINKPRSSFSS